ncbi:hypothetical protein EON66_00305 [archaeon]|nr:MAG: hypothetical protein EON66_00305 [archaeon]
MQVGTFGQVSLRNVTAVPAAAIFLCCTLPYTQESSSILQSAAEESATEVTDSVLAVGSPVEDEEANEDMDTIVTDAAATASGAGAGAADEDADAMPAVPSGQSGLAVVASAVQMHVLVKELRSAEQELGAFASSLVTTGASTDVPVSWDDLDAKCAELAPRFVARLPSAVPVSDEGTTLQPYLPIVVDEWLSAICAASDATMVWIVRSRLLMALHRQVLCYSIASAASSAPTDRTRDDAIVLAAMSILPK